MTIDIPSMDDHAAYRAFCEEHGQTYVPGFVQRAPVWAETYAFCPCCNYLFGDREPVPRKGRHCPACREQFWIRTSPDGIKRTVNRTAMIEIECLHAELNPYLDMVTMSVIPIGQEQQAADEKVEMMRVTRQRARQAVLAKYGKALPVEDIRRG